MDAWTILTDGPIRVITYAEPDPEFKKRPIGSTAKFEEEAHEESAYRGKHVKTSD